MKKTFLALFRSKCEERDRERLSLLFWLAYRDLSQRHSSLSSCNYLNCFVSLPYFLSWAKPYRAVKPKWDRRLLSFDWSVRYWAWQKVYTKRLCKLKRIKKNQLRARISYSTAKDDLYVMILSLLCTFVWFTLSDTVRRRLSIVHSHASCGIAYIWPLHLAWHSFFNFPWFSARSYVEDCRVEQYIVKVVARDAQNRIV